MDILIDYCLGCQIAWGRLLTNLIYLTFISLLAVGQSLAELDGGYGRISALYPPLAKDSAGCGNTELGSVLLPRVESLIYGCVNLIS